jgi:hypothetical protein
MANRKVADIINDHDIRAPELLLLLSPSSLGKYQLNIVNSV